MSTYVAFQGRASPTPVHINDEPPCGGHTRHTPPAGRSTRGRRKKQRTGETMNPWSCMRAVWNLASVHYLGAFNSSRGTCHGLLCATHPAA
jgi:hypothetical protein